MALTTQTMATAALKKALGFAQTDNSKTLGNEQFRTGFSTSLSSVFSEAVPTNPNKTALYDLTNGVVEYVRLVMTPDATSNGHAYFASLPSDYQASTTQPNKAVTQFANGTRLVDTAGVVQIVPSSFDPKYEVIPYSGGTSVKGSGTIIPPADARDWFIDPYNGVFFQQGSGGADSTVNYIECYVWVGGFLTDRLSLLKTGGLLGSSVVALLNNQYYVVDSDADTGLDATLAVSKWYVSSSYNGQAQACEVYGMMRNGVVSFNVSGILNIGAPLFKIDVDTFNGAIRLKARPTVNGITISSKRLAVY